MDIQAKVVELQSAMRAKGHAKAEAYVIVNAGDCSVMLSTSRQNDGESAFVSEYEVLSTVFHKNAPTLQEIIEAADAVVAQMKNSLAGGYARELGEVS